MTSIGERYGTVILVALFVGVPAGILVVIWMARRRIAAGWNPSWAWRASVSEVGIVVGTAPWVWMIMTPTPGAGGIQLVPFRDLAAVLTGDDTLVQLVGNLLVFAALGFFLPIRLRLAPPGAVVFVVAGIAAALSIVLEELQFALQLGRVSSIDDVILNALGAGLAALLSMHWWRSRSARSA